MQKIILLIIVSIISFSCAEKGYRIDVTINDIPDGRKVVLKKQEDRKIINIDSTTVQNGKFSFKGEIKEPAILGIFIDSIKDKGIMPFIDLNSKVSIIAYKDSLHKSEINGSKLHDELTKLRKERMEISKDSKVLRTKYQEASMKGDTATISQINSEMRVIFNNVAANDWKYVKNNPNSYVTPLVFNSVMTNPIYKDSVKIVYDNFSEEIKNSSLSKPIKDYFEYLEKQKNNPMVPTLPKDIQQLIKQKKK